MNEEELLKYLRKKPKKAQKQLFEQYSNAFFRICLRYCSNKEDAEEAMLNAFMKIFQKNTSFVYMKEGSFNAWMKRIMINEALMQIRKTKNFFIINSSEEIDNIDSISTDDNLNAEDIFSIIKELPTGYRVVFNLYAIEGYSHKEISEELNISISTSKSQLSKARKQLQKKITERSEPYEYRAV